jgi:hypothetical protein
MPCFSIRMLRFSICVLESTIRIFGFSLAVLGRHDQLRDHTLH